MSSSRVFLGACVLAASLAGGAGCSGDSAGAGDPSPHPDTGAAPSDATTDAVAAGDATGGPDAAPKGDAVGVGNDLGGATDAPPGADTGGVANDLGAPGDAAGCPDGATRCGGDCVNLGTDARHCGRCGNACPGAPNGTPACNAGGCALRCDPGYVATEVGCAPVAAPRPTGPLSVMRVTSRRPVFSWVLPPGLDGAEVEVCRDRACATPVTRFIATGRRGAPGADLPAGVLFWRLRGWTGGRTVTVAGPVWELMAPARTPATSAAWGAVPDVNGDGCADAVVGAPQAEGGAGRVLVYPGARAGLPTAPGTTVTGPGIAEYAMALAALADVNGDGYADMAVGAPDSSQVLVYHGGPAGLQSVAATTLVGAEGSRFGNSVASAGDVNGDGYGDLVVGAPEPGGASVYLGSATGLATAPAVRLAPVGTPRRFGYQVAGAGDVNADGYSDVIVGTYGSDEAYVYLGRPAGLAAAPDVTLRGAARSDFGKAVAGAGDVNGDGFSDVLVGSFTTAVTHVFHGSAAGLATTPAATLRETALDYADVVMPAGDVDGDGFADVVVLAPIVGQAFVYRGGATGVAATAMVVLRAPSEATFGPTGAAVGDTDCDGAEEVFLGDPEGNRVYLFEGGPMGPSAAPSVTLSGPMGQMFGRSVASLAPRLPRAVALSRWFGVVTAGGGRGGT